MIQPTKLRSKQWKVKKRIEITIVFSFHPELFKARNRKQSIRIIQLVSKPFKKVKKKKKDQGIICSREEGEGSGGVGVDATKNRKNVSQQTGNDNMT